MKKSNLLKLIDGINDQVQVLELEKSKIDRSISLLIGDLVTSLKLRGFNEVDINRVLVVNGWIDYYGLYELIKN